MIKRIKDPDCLIAEAEEYLLSVGYSPFTMVRIKRAWLFIQTFMISKGVSDYSVDMAKLAAHQYLKNRSRKRKRPNRYLKNFIYAVSLLNEYYQTGKIKTWLRTDKKRVVFKGAIGSLINDFLRYKRQEERLSTTRIACYRRYLFRFLTYCDKKHIQQVSKIDLPLLLHFISSLDDNRLVPVATIVSTLRGFMRYAFVKKSLPVDYSVRIPKCKTAIQPKLPSTYSQKEINNLIRSVDQSSATGKRNYAIILIAARLGLRASDICRLTFKSLQWDTSTIKIRQVKTSKELELPLLSDVGNAIIDYLKYGRPESEEPYVFLTARSPIEPLWSSNVVTHIVQRAFKKANINIKNRKFGPHSLRHSLSFRMLEQHTILPVISEVLGHRNTESTRYYLRIDLASMKQCILEVPPIKAGFYRQKGGWYYA
ncbi:MAG: site-specific integrase [Bacteroidota bacterium]|nr:site-specific integrase [Bacteroidota bacterium]